jgi:peptidoglycan/LPS O-acetylase OafA/YrhL
MGHGTPEQAAPETAGLRHNSALDGIRGLAILMVLGRHLIYISNNVQTPTYAIARGVRDSLFSGVDVFFALSGFLITRILVQTVSDAHFFRSFYARRALRIFPLYYGVLLVLFACTPIFHIHWRGDEWRLLTYSNRLFPDPAGEPWHFYYGGLVSLVNFWSLHIEEQFYMIWPLFVFLVRSPKRLLSIAAGISVISLGLRLFLYAHGFSQDFLYTSLITRIDSLLIGACLALALRTRFHALALRVATPVCLAATLLFVADLSVQHIAATRNLLALFPSEFTLISLAATALIAMCQKPSSRMARVFRTPVLRFFGKYSYGLYVFHSVLPMFYVPLLKSLTQRLHPHAMGNVINSVTELGVAVGVSMLSYRYFEMPFLKLKRFFPASSSSRQQDHGTAANVLT